MHIARLAPVAGLVSLLALTSTARSDLLWGVNGHPFTAYPGIPYRQQLELVKDLGVRSYRVNISAPSQAPMLARLVAEAKPLGIDILPVVTPGLDLKAESAEQLYAKAYKMAVTLVSRFKNEIRVWELGNELENFAIIRACEMRDNGEQYNCDWGPAGGVSPLDYYGPRWAKVGAVLKGLSDGTISVDPTIRKAIGTAGWGHVGAFERMHRDGIEWDISVWHMYGDDPEAAFRFLAKYNRPIWVTEFNNAYGSRRGEEEQVRGLVKQMQRLRELQHDYDVEAAHIYELLDEPYWAPSFEAVMGLARLEKSDGGRWKIGGMKPAYDAVKQLVAGASSGSLLQALGRTSKAMPEPGRVAAEPRSSPSVDRHDCDLARLASAPRPVSQHVQVDYAYCLILGRQSEPHGQAAWLDALRRSSSIETVLIGMLASSEFAIKYPIDQLNSEDVVKFAYRLLLDRKPDKQDLSSFAGQLESGLEKADFAKSIISSSEFRSKHPVLSAPGNTAPEKAQRDSGRARSCELRAGC